MIQTVTRLRFWPCLVAALIVCPTIALSDVDKKVTVDFRDTPIRMALEVLFRGTGLSYTLDPGSAGPVNVTLRDMPFDSALQAIVRSAGLTSVNEGGVYAIRPKDASLPTSGPVTPATSAATEPPAVELPSAEVRIEKIPLNFADAFDIGGIFGAQAMTSRLGAMVGATSGSGYGFGFGSGGAYGISGFNSYGYGGFGGSGLGYGSRSYSTYGSGVSGYGGYGSDGYGGSGYSGYLR